MIKLNLLELLICQQKHNGNHILHIKYEVIQQNIILFTFKKINSRICNCHNVNNVFSAEMVLCRKFK